MSLLSRMTSQDILTAFQLIDPEPYLKALAKSTKSALNRKLFYEYFDLPDSEDEPLRTLRYRCTHLGPDFLKYHDLVPLDCPGFFTFYPCHVVKSLLTTTDWNVVLSRLSPQEFESVALTAIKGKDVELFERMFGFAQFDEIKTPLAIISALVEKNQLALLKKFMLTVPFLKLDWGNRSSMSHLLMVVYFNDELEFLELFVSHSSFYKVETKVKIDLLIFAVIDKKSLFFDYLYPKIGHLLDRDDWSRALNYDSAPVYFEETKKFLAMRGIVAE